MLTGTLVNAAAILVGSLLGMLLTWLAGHFSTLLPAGSTLLAERLKTIIMQGVALCVMYLGISGCLEGNNSLIAILSMVLGALIGELLDLDKRMRSLGDWVQKRTEHLVTNGGQASISEGFVTASLLFCVGAMAIVGALQDGLTGDHSTLFAKSLLDGISSIVFGASLGLGVAFSAVAILLYQGLHFPDGLLSPALSGRCGDRGNDLCGLFADCSAVFEHAGPDQNQGDEFGPGHLPAHFTVPGHVTSSMPEQRPVCIHRALFFCQVSGICVFPNHTAVTCSRSTGTCQ